MLVLKYLLLTGAAAMFATAVGMVLYDLYLAVEHRRRVLAGGVEAAPTTPIRWRVARRIALLGIAPLLIGLSIVVVPSGMAAVRVSQISGTRPGTLYPGIHFIKPLIERVVLYDTRDKVFTTALPEPKKAKPEVLTVQAKEGLTIGLAITVRYRLDARRLDYIHNNLPQPVDTELVPPVVASAFRDLAPSYTVRDIFAARRDEVRQRATDEITRKLAGDGIVVKEVMLRDIQLPPEYAKGLEGLLLKEQENDRLSVETEIQQKQVRIAELQADAEKVQEIKKAEGDAQVHVLQAKAESDAMQYTLPLKEKQIQQTKLESEARKEATVKNAEAAAEAKIIDSKAELQRRNLLAEAEANRIRVTAAADAERMKSEAAVLKQNPLLINKIIAERLSDKVQIMMVPTDGKFFFNDVLRSPFTNQTAAPDDPPEEAPRKTVMGSNGNH
jgi:regulator of protease activity HflC (stomatin/prohibitin superfamily)